MTVNLSVGRRTLKQTDRPPGVHMEGGRNYLSPDEGEDVHLAGVGVLDRRNDEAGSAQRDLPL